jgi:alpha-beta hydrolase superfamily lysophospholipase
VNPDRETMAAWDRTYWKSHYVLGTDADEIEQNIQLTSFSSSGKQFELIYFEEDSGAPNILISQGSGGHAYVFAELAYRMHMRGYNVFIMPKHGDGFTIDGLVHRHDDAARHVSDNFTERLGIFGEGLGGIAVFYLALAHGPVKSIVCQNSPGILAEARFLRAIIEGHGAYKPMGRKLRLFKMMSTLFPSLSLPISRYLDWEELIDPSNGNRTVGTRLVEGYSKDPDFGFFRMT